MEKQKIEKQKIEKPKTAKIYQIYSPKADTYYIGSTFLPMNQRASLHKYHYKMMIKGMFPKFTAIHALQNGDAVYSVIKEYKSIDKKRLHEIETDFIIKLKKKLGGKLVNKNSSGLTRDMKQYQRNYRANNPEKFQQYYEENKEKLKAYHDEYYKKNKEKLNAQRKANRNDEMREEIVTKLNGGGYKRIPYKKIEKYGITKDGDKYQ